ncbi:hypothetical protein [Natrinema versiforme]|uniref:Uncharacterized protein n=1 Tax=Natrinema versiforme TaxID=88724 RepID=A0A4V1FY83_9EURY|nr:hypothetical protein [Natrinema versiforme]QCS41234.1 hypothetical protein FEJ81_02290 [Natrinema versiforme]
MVGEIVTSLGSAAVGGIIGAAATLLSSFGLHKRRMNNKEERIRLAIITELKSTEIDGDGDKNKSVFQNTMEYVKNQERVPENGLADKTVYENVSNELGLLEKEEVKKIVEYYSSLNTLNSMTDNISGIIDRGEINENDAKVFVRQLSITDEHRREAIETLERNQDS